MTSPSENNFFICPQDFCLDMIYQQVSTLADYMNLSNKENESWKYADFIIYYLKRRLQEDYPNAKFPDGKKIGQWE